jgi:hypothetical protein
MIHISHTKKDLYEIIESYQLYMKPQLKHYNELSKDDLCEYLWTIILKMRKIPKCDKMQYFETMSDVRSYLIKSSPNRCISGDLLLDIGHRTKNIIYYCKKCGYVIQLSNYDCLEDIIKDADIIRLYGNIPSVRRAIKLINRDVKIKRTFELEMSNATRRTLRIKEETNRQTSLSGLKKIHGEHLIVFE